MTEKLPSHEKKHQERYKINLGQNNAARSLQENQSGNDAWGDGLRTSNEHWDDSNTKNGDGCSSEWEVEKGYICTRDNSTSSDEWIRCPAGYKSFRYFENSDYVECKPESDRYNVIFYITIVVLGIGMIKYFIKDFIRVYKQDKENRNDMHYTIEDIYIKKRIRVYIKKLKIK